MLTIILFGQGFQDISNHVCFNCVKEWGIGRIINFIQGKVEPRCCCWQYAENGTSVQVIWDYNKVDPWLPIHGDVKTPRLILLELLNFSIMKIYVKS